jgi:DNA polymerase III sliding clamp (beta) subunit (PCNA family)
MLLNKKSLDCISIFASTDPSRSMMLGVHVETNGNLVATDGHILGIVTPGDGLDEKDFPNIGQSSGDIPPLKPCTLAVDGLKALAKAIPTKSRMPIIKHALLDHTATNANRKAVFHVTDLDNPKVINIAKLDGTFPNYVAAMPNDPPVYRIVFDAELLKRLVTAALTLGKDQKKTYIELEFVASGLSGMKATSTNKDGRILTALVMPYKGERPREEYGLLVPAIIKDNI